MFKWGCQTNSRIIIYTRYLQYSSLTYYTRERATSQLVVQTLLRGRVHGEVLPVASPPAQVLQQQIRTESDGYCQYQEVSHRREHEKYAEKSHSLATRSLYYPLHLATALLYQPCFSFCL